MWKHTLVCTEAHKQQLIILGTEAGGGGSCICGFCPVMLLLLKSTDDESGSHSRWRNVCFKFGEGICWMPKWLSLDVSSPCPYLEFDVAIIALFLLKHWHNFWFLIFFVRLSHLFAPDEQSNHHVLVNWSSKLLQWVVRQSILVA